MKPDGPGDRPLIDRIAAVVADSDSYLPTARAQPVRASEAAGCAAAIQYGIRSRSGEVERPRMDPTSLVAMGIGTSVHEQWFAQAMLAMRSNVTEVELEAGWELPEYKVSGHSDALITQTIRFGPGGWEAAKWPVVDDEGESSYVFTTVVELKTINGTGFKRATVGDNPEGPRRSALLQGALNALGHDADDLVIVYIASEAISISNARRSQTDDLSRVMVQWTYPREVWEPLAHAEGKRMAAIALINAEGERVRRVLEDEREIIDPVAAIADDTSRVWQCDYCLYRPECIKDWKQEAYGEAGAQHG